MAHRRFISTFSRRKSSAGKAAPSGAKVVKQTTKVTEIIRGRTVSTAIESAHARLAARERISGIALESERELLMRSLTGIVDVRWDETRELMDFMFQLIMPRGYREYPEHWFELRAARDKVSVSLIPRRHMAWTGCDCLPSYPFFTIQTDLSPKFVSLCEGGWGDLPLTLNGKRFHIASARPSTFSLFLRQPVPVEQEARSA